MPTDNRFSMMPNPEVRLARWELQEIIRQQTEEMTFASAAEHTGLSQYVYSKIRSCVVSSLSLRELVAALKRLGNDVEISVKVTKSGKRP